MYVARVRPSVSNSTGKRNVSTCSMLEAFPKGKDTINNNVSDCFSGKVTTSNLANGMKVISKEGNGINTSFGLFVRAGPAFENASTASASLFLKFLSLKSTVNTNGLRVTRYIESISSKFDVVSNRDTVQYNVDFLRPNAENVGTFLSEIMRPRLAEWEVRDTKEEVQKDIKSNKKKHAVLNGLYFAAYKQGVGRALYSGEGNVDNITNETLGNYVTSHYQPNAITLVGVGIDHAALTHAADAFSYLSQSPVPTVANNFVGGDFIEEDLSSGSTQLLVAYPISDLATFRVAAAYLQLSLPSNLCAAVFDGTNAGCNFPFFGVSAKVPFGTSQATQTAIKDAFSSLSSKKIDANDFAAASALAKMNLLGQMENKDSLKSLLYHYGNPADLLTAINAVTPESLNNAVSSLSSSRPITVCIGDIAGLSF